MKKTIKHQPLVVIATLAGCLAAVSVHAADFAVTTTADTTDMKPGDSVCSDAAGHCSLRAAIQEANELGGGSVITLAPAVYALTLTGAAEDYAVTGDLDVRTDIVVQGNNAVVDAIGHDRAFDVFPSGSLSLSTARVVNGEPPVAESGGAFRSSGELILTRVTVSDSFVSGAGASGGGVFNDAGSLTIIESMLSGNSSERAGGAVEANAGTTVIERSTMENNVTGPSPGNGGAFHLTGAGDVTVTGGVVRNNQASAEGGGLWNSNSGTMTIAGVLLADNTASGGEADQGGGALFNDGGIMTVRFATIDYNIADGASGSGGGILNNNGTLRIVGSKLTGNSANRAGGGIESNLGSNFLTRVDLVENSTGASPGNGGGLHITGAGDATILGGTVKSNTAAAEGGGLWNGSGAMRVIGVKVTDNTAAGAGSDQGGGGLFNAGGTLQVRRSTIVSNTATGASGSGGGILNDQGTLLVRNTGISGNSASRAGGGIEANVGDTTVAASLLFDNHTGAAPGNGGALHLTGAGNVLILTSGVAFNSAANEGGGLWNSMSGTMAVYRTQINDNTAPTGEDVFNDGGDFTINGSPVPSGR